MPSKQMPLNKTIHSLKPGLVDYTCLAETIERLDDSEATYCQIQLDSVPEEGAD